MKLLSSNNNNGMLLKNPKGLISKGTQMYKITSGTNFSGLTSFPVFEIVSFDDSSNVTKLSNTKIQLTADKKYRLTCEAYGDGSAVQQFGFYDVTNSQFVGSMGVGSGLTTSVKAELIIRPTVTTEVEVRPVASSTFTTQYIWTTYVEEVESNVNDTAQAIKQMTKVYNTVVDMQSAMGLKLGDVVETLGYTTKNDGLGRKYIITATDVDSLGILVNGKYASKYKERIYNSELLNGENKATMFTSPIFTGTPTAPTATSGETGKQLANLDFVNAMLGGNTVPAKLLSANGYVKMANGLIIQWGRGGSDSTSVTFPIVFPNACLNVVVSANVNADGPQYSYASKVKTTSTSGVTLYVNAPNCYWIAIGY